MKHQQRVPFGLLGAAVLAGSLTSACFGKGDDGGKHAAQDTAPAAPAVAAAPVERFVPVAAVEARGATTIDREPFPAQPLPEGNGYIMNKPDANGRWEVLTFRWDPGTIIVNQGEKVTLEILGVHGRAHPFTLHGYDVKGSVKRGEVASVSFVADKPGIFLLECDVHHPAMHANLVVLLASGALPVSAPVEAHKHA